MKKTILGFLFLIAALFAGVAFAPPEARRFIGWTIALLVVFIAIAIAGWVVIGSVLGWKVINIRIKKMMWIYPNEAGDMPITQEGGVWENHNMLPPGAPWEQQRAHALWRLTSGHHGSPPASVFTGQLPMPNPAPDHRQFPMIEEGLMVDAVAEEL